jgi:hypothetical protein
MKLGDNQKFSIIVICPTRDRPESLRKTLQGINSYCLRDIVRSYAIVIIDDSILEDNRKANQCLVAKSSKNNIFYFGLQEERFLISQLKACSGVSQEILNCYLRPLGGKNWDLGAIRNYALLLVNIIGMTNATVVMIDDDVKLVSLPSRSKNKNKSLKEMINVVEQNRLALVGGRLKGDPDASTIERVCLHWGKLTKNFYFKLPNREIPISGGLMAFSSYWASRIPFPRLYNEDWIWLRYCSMFGGRIVKSKVQAQHVNVTQINTNEETLYKELIGEIFFDGWNWAYRNYKTRQYCYRILQNNKYWLDVLAGQLRFINRTRVNFLKSKIGLLKHHSLPSQFISTKLIFDRVCSLVNGVKAEYMVQLTNEYIDSLVKWQHISSKIQKTVKRISLIY